MKDSIVYDELEKHTALRVETARKLARLCWVKGENLSLDFLTIKLPALIQVCNSNLYYLLDSKYLGQILF